MVQSDSISILEPEALARARGLLKPRIERDPVWPALGAAAFAAVTSLAFAAAMILAPPVITEHVVRTSL